MANSTAKKATGYSGNCLCFRSQKTGIQILALHLTVQLQLSQVFKKRNYYFFFCNMDNYIFLHP